MSKPNPLKRRSNQDSDSMSNPHKKRKVNNESSPRPKNTNAANNEYSRRSKTNLSSSSSSSSSTSSSRRRTIKLISTNRNNSNRNNASNIPQLSHPPNTNSTHHTRIRFNSSSMQRKSNRASSSSSINSNSNSSNSSSPNPPNRSRASSQHHINSIRNRSSHSNKSSMMSSNISINASSSSSSNSNKMNNGSSTNFEQTQTNKKPIIGNIADYPIYGQKDEMSRCKELIKNMDAMINAMKYLQEEEQRENDNLNHNHNRNHHKSQFITSSTHKNNLSHCPKYMMAEKKLCEPNTAKLEAIKTELEKTNKYFENKYKCKEKIVENEYEELSQRAKNRLTAKYQDRKSKQERLFKIEFNKHQKKIEKAKKKALKKEQDANNSNSGSASIKKEKTPICSDDILIEKDKYPRWNLINNDENENKMISSHKKSWPAFSTQAMQEKWKQISGVRDTDMEEDVNTMVAITNQNKMNKNAGNKNKGRNRIGGALEIKDILAMFPKCDVSYKPDKNSVMIQQDKRIKKSGSGIDDKKKRQSETITLKVGSYIACQQKRQSVMIGTITSISSRSIWCRLRRKGAKCTDHTLTEIKVVQIEEGDIKIKLIN